MKKNNFNNIFNIPLVIPLLKQENIIATYTVLKVLNKMQAELGIEAMHEYKDVYLEMIEKHNLKLKVVVEQLLEELNVEKIYHDCFENEKN